MKRSRASAIIGRTEMMVREVMRRLSGLDESATLDDVVEAIQTTGCEVLPVVQSANGSGDLVVRQLVAVRDLPNLRRLAEVSGTRGHAIGRSVLDLLAALGRQPGKFPTISPDAALADAWGLMSDAHLTHLPVVDDQEVIGMVSLVVTFTEFPHRSPAAGFWS
jgi:CBS domain-containing protein